MAAGRISSKHGGFKRLIGDASNPTLGIALPEVGQNVSYALHLIAAEDAALDWNVSAYSDPTLVIHCKDTNAPTDYISIWHDDTDANIQAYGATQITLGIGGTEYLNISSTAFYPTTTDGIALGTSSLNFSDLFLDSGAVINFDGGDVTLTHSSNTLTMAGGAFTMGSVTASSGDFTLWGTNGASTTYRVLFDVNGDTNGAWYFGGDDYGIDVAFYGQTASNSMLWDASGDGLTFTGATFTMGTVSAPAGDFTLWGTNGASTTYRVLFDVNGDTNGAWYFGGDDYGIDVGFYGQTASNSMLWDASSNALVFTAGGITMGVASTLILPVKASGSTTQGDIWYDTTDDMIHYYSNAGGEYTITAT